MPHALKELTDTKGGVTVERLAYNLKEAAEAAGVSAPTMQAWVNRSDFPAMRSGRRWIIPVDAFRRWLEEQAAKNGQTL